jgi:hypothetical protein
VRSLLEVKKRELTLCATLRVLTHCPGAGEVSCRRQQGFFVGSIVHDVTNKDQTVENLARVIVFQVACLSTAFDGSAKTRYDSCADFRHLTTASAITWQEHCISDFHTILRRLIMQQTRLFLISLLAIVGLIGCRGVCRARGRA